MFRMADELSRGSTLKYDTLWICFSRFKIVFMSQSFVVYFSFFFQLGNKMFHQVMSKKKVLNAETQQNKSLAPRLVLL